MKFLVGNQLPQALARFIESEFQCVAVHVADIGLRDASDNEVWRFASETGSVLISKDEDFAGLALQMPGATLIWLRVGNCRKAAVLEVFRSCWSQIWHLLESGERIVEIC